MAKGVFRLSAIDLKRKAPGHYGDGLGLWLQITRGKHGANRSWVFRYTAANGRPREMGLGGTHTISLAKARELARECRELRLRGVDPIEHRKAQRAAQAVEAKRGMSFDECARAFLAAKRNEWRSEKHAQTWPATITKYVSPVIGKLPADQIDTPLIMKVLQPLWERIPESASRLRGRIESILDWAAVSGFRQQGDNPARWRGHLEHLLATPHKLRPKEHMAAMPYADLPAFMRRLKAEQSTTAGALEFLILTAARAGEIRGAAWSEIDPDRAVWSIPGERMKAGKAHRVPLSSRCVELLRATPRQGTLVFPGRAGGMMADSNLVYLMRKLDCGEFTVHGFRSSFRDWAGEQTNFPREICEAALAHTIGNKVEQAYRRGDALEKRRKLMEAWATFCGHPVVTGTTVTPLRKIGADA
jgi:integrase